MDRVGGRAVKTAILKFSLGEGSTRKVTKMSGFFPLLPLGTLLPGLELGLEKQGAILPAILSCGCACGRKASPR